MVTLPDLSPTNEEILRLQNGDIQWFIDELDAYTPCIQVAGNNKQIKIYRRFRFLIKKILLIGKKHYSKPQYKKLVLCLRYAAYKHNGVYRKDEVTPYLIHPLEVACLLIDDGVYDFKTILAAILHDVPEDTSENLQESVKTLREIGKLFGSGVENIVSLVTVPPDSLEKKSYISFIKKGAEVLFGNHGDNMVEQMILKPSILLKKQQYFEAMKNEPDLNCRWRVIVIKIRDRTHNVRTLGVMPKDKQKNKIEETKREGPELLIVLEKTLARLHERGTLKNKKFLELPKKLRASLELEMNKKLLELEKERLAEIQSNLSEYH